MDRAQLLQHFDTLAETPEAVEKLRTLVFDLAIRGSLLSQNPADESASSLLGKIRQQKQKAENGTAQKNKANGDQPEVTKPFALPAGWEWTVLSSVALRIHYGYTASAIHGDTGVRLLRITDIQDGQVNWDSVPGCQILDREIPKYELRENDVLIARTGGTIGKSFLVRGVTVRAVFASYLIRVIPSDLFCADYLSVFLSSSFYWEQLRANSAGTGQPNVNGEALSQLLLPVPPLAEQRRIVAKVEELLALCDALEARQTAAREHRIRLVRSALDHLTTGVRPSPGAATSARTTISGSSDALRPHHAAAPEDGRTPDDFRRHAAFVLNQFPDLTAASEDVPALRQAILSLAVQGRIGASEKTAWQRCKLRDIVTLITSGSRGWAEFYADEGPLFLRAQNVRRDGSLLLEDVAHVRLPEKSEGSRTRVQKDDLLVVITGAGVSQTTRVKQDLGEAYVSQHVALLRLREPAFAPWLDFQLHAAAGCFGQLQELIYGAKPGLNLENLRALELSLPPLAEQQRIVAKVDELLRWCDALEARLTAARTTATRLLDATLHQILAN